MMATLVGVAAWAVTGRPRTAARLSAARAARNRRDKRGAPVMGAGGHAGWAAVHARSPYVHDDPLPMANGTIRPGTSGAPSAARRGICDDGADDQLRPARPAQRGDYRAR